VEFLAQTSELLLSHYMIQLLIFVMPHAFVIIIISVIVNVMYDNRVHIEKL